LIDICHLSLVTGPLSFVICPLQMTNNKGQLLIVLNHNLRKLLRIGTRLE
jgi:hypothetical protein